MSILEAAKPLQLRACLVRQSERASVRPDEARESSVQSLKAQEASRVPHELAPSCQSTRLTRQPFATGLRRADHHVKSDGGLRY